MKYAIVNNTRTIATSSGRGKCPCCKNDVIAKCGIVKIHHWAHVSLKDCDPWWEGETEWHRDWKGKFPEEWQEVVMFDEDGTKHIADIKTVNGVVVELQNSPISPSELNQREMFYKNLIWIVNAIPFKDNITPNNKVEYSEIQWEKNDCYNKIKLFESTILDEIKQIKQQISASNKNLNRILQEEDTYPMRLISAKKKFYELSYVFIENILYGYHRELAYEYKWLFRKLKNKFGAIIIFKNNKIKDIESEIKRISDRLSIINALPDKEIGDKKLKIIYSLKEVEASNYNDIYAIVNSSKIEPVLNETDLIRIEKMTNFIICKDYSHENKKYLESINRLNQYKENIVKEIEQLKTKIKLELDILIEKELGQCKEKKSQIFIEEEKCNKEISTYESDLKKVELKNNSLLRDYKAKMNKELSEKIAQIKKRCKDRYYFKWRHKKEVWIHAQCKIFFDIGESYLYWIIDSETLKKIDKQIFLDHVKKIPTVIN